MAPKSHPRKVPPHFHSQPPMMPPQFHSQPSMLPPHQFHSQPSMMPQFHYDSQHQPQILPFEPQMMPPQAPPRIDWEGTHGLKLDFIQLCQREVNKEGYMGVSLTKHSWKKVIDELNLKYINIGLDQKKVKNEWDHLRKKYTIWRMLKNYTGNNHNEVTNTFNFNKERWTDIIEKYPDAKQFKSKGLEHHDLLKSLFEGTLSTGNTMWTSRMPVPNYPEMHGVSDEQSSEHSNSEIPRSPSTQARDETQGHHDSYFRDYMFENNETPSMDQEWTSDAETSHGTSHGG